MGSLYLYLVVEQIPYFVFFAPGSASLDPPARTVVADAAAYAKVYPFAPITVTGYGDPSAGPQEAEEMAHRRAEALAKALAACCSKNRAPSSVSTTWRAPGRGFMDSRLRWCPLARLSTNSPAAPSGKV